MVAGIWDQIAPADLVILTGVVTALLAITLLITWFVARRLLGFSRADEVVLQFCGTTKSLASGLPIASVLFASAQLGLVLMPLMIFHQLQLVACAVLARHYGARADAAADDPGSLATAGPQGR
jgi:sodium/bile acid cotransporter 7